MPKLNKARAADGEGSIFKPAGKTYFRYKFYLNGQKYEGSTGQTDEREARRVKNTKMAEASQANAKKGTGPAVAASYTVADALDVYLESVEERTGSDTTPKIYRYTIESTLKPAFGDMKVVNLTSEDLDAWRKQRVLEGKSHATVNRNLQLLQSALKHAMNRKKIASIPFFEMRPERNVRQGFLDVDQYYQLLAELPPALKPLFICGYHLGVRRGALTKFRWDWIEFSDEVVDGVAGFIVVPRYVMKNEEPITLPIYGDMIEALREQKKLRDEQFPDCPWVFFWTEGQGWGGLRRPAGSQIQDFRESWNKATEKAGLGHVLFHDLRRSAVRNMIQEVGIPESQAMKISGHKTRSMLERYNITSRRDIQSAGSKLAVLFDKRNRKAGRS